MDRRRFLRAASAGAGASVAGCLDAIPGIGGGSGDGVPIDEHAAAADLDDQPRRGDLDRHVVVSFEDPSCSRCRAFESQTVPKIRSKLVEPGKAAYVVRTYPVVYPWGERATHALEATFARSEPAFWQLLGHYFDRQPEFSTENVLDRTRSFLDANTDLDGAAVTEDVTAGAYDDAVQADLDAGNNAELGRTTPVVVLFRDGRYATKASGSVSYDLIATALGET